MTSKKPFEGQRSDILPSPRDDEGSLARPLAGIEAAMQVQVEILKRLHDQQRELGDAVRDTRRAEMMIQSTQSLNESFSGMRRVQERLIDRLNEGSPTRSWIWLLAVALGLVGVAAAIIFGVNALSDRVNETGEKLAQRSGDPVAQAALTEVQALREHLQGIEDRDQKLFMDRLDRLQGRIQELEADRSSLQQERDRAREDLGKERAESERWKGQWESHQESHRSEIASLKEEASGFEKDVSRLTELRIQDQQMIRQLSESLAKYQGGVGVTTGERTAPVTPSDGSVVEIPPAALTSIPGVRIAGPGDGESSTTPNPSEPETVPSPASLAESAAGNGGAVGERLVSPAILATLNQLLSDHRGSETYEIRAVTSYDGEGLREVVLDVKGRDGSLAKTVTAKRMTFSLSPTASFVELDFRDGYIEFRQGSGRSLRSPFFDNRYQIVVLGVARETWLASRLPFLKTR